MARSSRPWLPVLLLAATLPSSAHATTYYLSPTGNDANAGTSQSAPWKSVTKANATLRAGDVCVLLPGAYTQSINPANSGTSAARITYLGSLGNPAAAIVPSISIQRAYVTVKGVTSTGSLDLGYTNETSAARYDSVAWCVVRGVGFAGAKYCMVARNQINGSVSFLLDRQLTLSPAISNSEYDTLRGNRIDVGVITSKGFILRGYTQKCLIDSNQIAGTFSGTNGDVQGRYLYNTYNNVFRDNRWTFEALNAYASGPWVAFALRDSSHHILFERDTMLCGVSSGYSIGGRLVNSGNAAWVGRATDNRWVGCFYKTTSYIWTQDAFNNSTIEECTFASRDSWGLWTLGAMRGCTIRHNTFFSGRGHAVRVEGDIRPGGNTISSNIFYSDSVTACSGGGGVLRHGYTTGFTQDNNLYHARSGPAGATLADLSLVWGGYTCSRPGAGYAWSNATGNDLNSRYGSPQFANATFAGFDPRLGSGSAAIGVGSAGTNAGPGGLLGPSGDAAPPAAITSLTVSSIRDRSAVLTWNATGDDGTTGIAAAYDMRWSTQPISIGNFASAAPVPGVPAPLPAGSVQSLVLDGLSPGQTVYCAMLVRDEANNWSSLSNVRQFATASADVVPPAAVWNLGGSP